MKRTLFQMQRFVVQCIYESIEMSNIAQGIGNVVCASVFSFTVIFEAKLCKNNQCMLQMARATQ